MNVSEPMMLN